MSEYATERRIKALALPEDLALAIIAGRVALVDFDLPADARVLTVQYEWQHRTLNIIIESASYPPVPAGTRAEMFMPMLRQVAERG